MNIEQEKIKEQAVAGSSPFTGAFTPQEFHPEIGRLNLLRNIRQDLAEGAPLVALTGDSGSGKSVIGCMLASEQIDGCMQVYFGKTVISFEDVVQTVAAAVQVEVADLSRKGIAAAVEEVACKVSTLPERLLLIFDGAERIYLATLERIRKMLDRVNAQAVHMQVVFLGRHGLLDNLKQLAVCNLDDIPEKHYALQPLSQAETALYIDLCTARLSRGETALFTTETVERIYKASRGNFRKVNQCAEEVLKRRNPETSFQALSESADGAEDLAKSGLEIPWYRKGFRCFSGKAQWVAGSALTVTLAVGLVLATGSKEETKESLSPVEKQEAVAENRPAVPAATEAGDGIADTDQVAPVGSGEDTLLPEEAVHQLKPLVAEGDPEQEGAAAAVDAHPERIADQIPAEREDLPRRSTEDRHGQDVAGVPEVEGPRPGNVADTSAEDGAQAAEIVLIESRQTARKNLPVEPEKAEPVLLRKELTKLIRATSPVISPELVEQPADSVAAGVDNADPVAEGSATFSLSADEIDQVFNQTGHYAGMDAAAKTYSSASQASIALVPAAEGEGLLSPDNQIIDPLPKKVLKPAEATVTKINIENSSTKIVSAVDSVHAAAKGETGALAGEEEDGTAAGSGVDNLYASRRAAGESWLDGGSDSKYTMQLMVLSADNARTNIGQLLGSEDYRDEVDNMFIFEGRQNPEQVFIFYGEYDSIETARSARDTIPGVLKQHNPYVLAVPVAVQKFL